MTDTTDYLIIGAGAMGLAFADELLTRSDATMTIVDKRSAPGGHWNDAYSFVKLHQPAIFYGVESTSMGRDRVETSGPNAGFMELAEGPEILAYFHALMRDRLLPSGRVTYRPLTEVREDGTLRHVLSGQESRVEVRRKTVDATWYENAVPATHGPKFEVAEGAWVVPPNALPRLAAKAERFVVVGAGKTGVDVCVWLLENGVPADRLAWIVSRDPWFLNRKYTQPGPEFFESTFGNFAAQRRAMAEAANAQELCANMEACGAWLRLDPDVQPTMFHAATISEGELALLRSIRNTVRGRRVGRAEAERVILDDGSEIASSPETLVIDCTTTALPVRDLKPVFAPGRITLQMTRFPMLPFSAAFAAFLEATFETDDEKNGFAQPLPLTDTVNDFIAGLTADMINRYACSKHPAVREWVGNSRLDGYSRIAREIPKDDAARQAILKEVGAAAMAAAGNLGRLTGSG
ncbi:MAG: NAD(P)-binding protein [Alphaproteobacteria bacterium]|nr:NAD(P)-binding protein [Alphaproteobacteria bacterium]